MSQVLVKGIARGDVNPITKMPFQGESVHTEMVMDRSYPLKEFKLERGRRQLDLPAQKNVLTNYFCPASVEAKREFKAPRMTPTPLNSMEGSSPSCERFYWEDAYKDSETSTDDSPKISMEYGLATDASISPDSPIGNELALILGCFHAVINQDNCAKYMNDVAGNLRGSEHSVPLELSKPAIYKPCPTLRKENESKFISDGVESKTRSVTKKVIVRSSYFQHKPKNEDLQSKSEELVSEKEATGNVLCESVLTGGALFESTNLKSALTKRGRKTIPTKETQEAIGKVKHARADPSVPIDGTNSHLTKPLSVTTQITIII
ncbi:hypothetical protein IFM89_013636 [Coptis chinensis]|uniref:Uncharacterized protein n=1 Tax=Coptis chinensis TaxID=261450 RepID=A0A835IMM7_9MAGN|nr:hypothetical protein IFM89_013636 [Coptis chinensis]